MATRHAGIGSSIAIGKDAIAASVILLTLTVVVLFGPKTFAK
jgi:hypothetical protein